MLEDMGLRLDDDTVRFIPCPSNSSCCSFAATESHVFLGHAMGEITVCCLKHHSRELEIVAAVTTLLPAGPNEAKGKRGSHGRTTSSAIDCLCVCPYASTSGILLSSLHRDHVVTFVTYDATRPSSGDGSLQIGRSMRLSADGTRLQYTNRVTAHCWLDDDTFLVGCLNGVVLAVSASVNDSHRVMLREESPIIQIVWDAETSVLVVSSVRRSVVVTYANDSMTLKPIGSKPREEGFFGACIWPINHAVYVARHNARVFEYAPSMGAVSRTYRIESDAALGVLKPLQLPSFWASCSHGDENLDEDKQHDFSPILLWSEGPHFISFLFLSATATHHVTRCFIDVAIVSSVVLSSMVLVLCSDGRLMYVPLGSDRACFQHDWMDTALETSGQPTPEEVQSAAKATKQAHRKRIMRKVVRVVRRRKSLGQRISRRPSEGDAFFSACADDFESSSTADDKLHSCGSAVSPKQPSYLDRNESLSDKADAEGTTQHDDAPGSRSLQEEGCSHTNSHVFSHLSKTVTSSSLGDADSLLLEQDNTTGMNGAGKGTVLEEKSFMKNPRCFRVKLDHMIRLFNVHALRLGEHEQLYTAVQEFLPLLEEQMIECGVLTRPFQSVLSHVRANSYDANSPAACEINTTDKSPFIEEEATVSALRNVLKSALAWSIKDNAGDVDNPWIQTLFILHLLLAVPWPASPLLERREASDHSVEELERHRWRRRAEEVWLEQTSVIEKAVERCGADARYLPLVLALSHSVVSSFGRTQSGPTTRSRLLDRVDGYEQCMLMVRQLQVDWRSLTESQCPPQIGPHLEQLIVEQSPHILDAMEASPHPFCSFYAYFPYIFATYPSKANMLSMQHYPGVSLAFFEWALSSSVQGLAFQRLRKMGSEVERLSLEDLADGLVDLVLALLEASGSSICEFPADYLACLRILLQRRFTLLWSRIKMGQLKRNQTACGGDAREDVGLCHEGEEWCLATLRTQRKLQRVEGGVLGLLQHAQSVMLTRGVGNSVPQEEFKQHVLNLLEEHDFPDGVVALCWTREYIDHCISKGCVERLQSLFELPGATSQEEWTFLFKRAHEKHVLEIAVFFCLSVEKLPDRVRRLLQHTFPMRFGSVEAARGDEQLERVVLKLNMML